MRRIVPIAAFLASASAAWSQDAAERLEKKVQEAADFVSSAFVFFPGGSGMFISADGYALTNHHVAGSQKSCRVTLHDGRNKKATNICTDAVGDVALFKVEDLEGPVPFLALGDSDRLEVGQYVIAVGNPFGLAGPTPNKKVYPSVSLGIVSALHRYQQQYSDCIQTDAAVNPGNSGGPLVTLDGRMVGINGRIATRYFNRVNSGVGYAISSNQVKNFLPEMMKGGKDGKIHHGQVNGLELSRHHQNGRGALVSGVRGDSTADKAGFRADDLIVRVERYGVFCAERYHGIVGTYPEGARITVVVQRGEREVELPVVLDRSDGPDIMGNRPRRETPGGGYLGVQLEDREDGVHIEYVKPGSPADLAGILEGDVVVKFDGRPVKDRNDVLERLGAKKPGTKVAIVLRRGSEEVTVEATLGKRP